MALNYDDDSKVVVDTQHQLNVFQLWVDRGMLSIIFFFFGYKCNTFYGLDTNMVPT